MVQSGAILQTDSSHSLGEKKRGIVGNITGAVTGAAGVFTGAAANAVGKIKGHQMNASMMPGIQANTHAHHQRTESASGIQFDFNRLSDETFNVEIQIRTALQKLPNEDSIQQLHLQLADIKDITSQELRKNVFKNYNEFVIISKEITKLEGDMIAVKSVLSELKEVRDNFGSFGQVANTVAVSTPLDNGMDDVDEDEIAKQLAKEEIEKELKRTRLGNLYREIDGLQKSLPENPSRYLEHDGSQLRLTEINPANYKQKDVVYIHVLSDFIVVALWKKNMMSGKNRLVPDKLFGINEIAFIDMKDSPEMNFAFKIMKGSELYMYKAETLQEKKSVISVIIKVTGDLLTLKKMELESKKSAISMIPSPSLVVAPIVEKENKKILKDNLSEADYRWLLELSDDLDVLIAHRDFDQAVLNVEKARQIMALCDNDTARLQFIRSSIEERITTLSEIVSIDLTSTSATKNQIQADIDRLQRLGLGDHARDIYLTTRSQVIRHRLRQLHFNGDIVAYMFDYCDIFFRLIKNTCDWFGGSFHDPSMASGFMKWIQIELDYFGKKFRKQIFGVDHEFHIIAECVITALDRCEELHSVGMNLTSTFENIINDDLMNAIEVHAVKCDKEIFHSVMKDNYNRLDLNTEIFDSANIKFDECWQTSRGPRRFGFCGVQLFVLDMHYLLKAFESYVTEEANDLSNKLCERALRSYFAQNKTLSAPLKHQSRALRQLQNGLHHIDLVVEVRDARIPLTSINTEFDNILGRRDRLVIYNKSDLANPEMKSSIIQMLNKYKNENVVFTKANKGQNIKAILDYAIRSCSL
ncbi:exocyst complex component exo84 [Globomyces sp. JEL0801]|nr:exocyst complex component exo84 [Globomyces sp. JEL0801]